MFLLWICLDNLLCFLNWQVCLDVFDCILYNFIPRVFLLLQIGLVDLAMRTIVWSNKVSVTNVLKLKENSILHQSLHILTFFLLLLLIRLYFRENLTAIFEDSFGHFLVHLDNLVVAFDTIKTIDKILIDREVIDNKFTTNLAFVDFLFVYS